jgi:hypothetical protein
MARVHLPALLALEALAICASWLAACGTAPSHPSSLVSVAGAPSQGGRPGQGAGGAGETGKAATAGGDGGGDGGAAGDTFVGTPPTALAVFMSTLDVNTSCAGDVPSTALLIQNGGGSTLTIASASADSGYTVQTALPVSIAPGAGATLLVLPPAPKSSAGIGDTSEGSLTFSTNEPDTPTHDVALHTTLYGAHLEFTDHDGTPLVSVLTLSYLNDSLCPDSAKYRVHNTGNVAFTLVGPSFPAHFSGTTTGASGVSVAPDGYVELMVGGVSSPGGVCQGSGVLSFSTTGAFCGSAPSLNVAWPASAGPSCTCGAAQ